MSQRRHFFPRKALLAHGRRLVRCAAALVAALGVAMASAQTVVGVASLILPAARGDATHDLRLTLHHFRDSRWRADAIAAAVVEAAGLLAQCGIALTSAELREIDAPRRLHFYATPRARELVAALDAPRPALFFVEDTLMRPAFDAEAIGRGNARTRPQLADTVWIAHGTRDLGQVIAHELVHVLADSGAHSELPGNLMRDATHPEHVHLTSAQCEAMRTTATANGLMAPLAPGMLKPRTAP
ncbi:MAG: hypothetical protein JNM79_07375 [Burkholderiales bacterium]|nr:hypothetical protein [Burkholderiales bacterium]